MHQPLNIIIMFIECIKFLMHYWNILDIHTRPGCNLGQPNKFPKSDMKQGKTKITCMYNCYFYFHKKKNGQ